MEDWLEEVLATPEECAVEQSMHQLLTKHKLLKVVFYDGHWSEEILLPNASQEFEGNLAFALFFSIYKVHHLVHHLYID